VIAHVVAAPVAGRRLVVSGRDPSYVDLDGFVVVVVGRGGPLLPNGVVLTDRPQKGELSLAGAQVWDPALRLPADPERLGAEILQTLKQPYERGQTPLLAACERGQTPLLAADVARALIGRGPGLTPEGDDTVAATAAVVAVGPWPAAEKAAWLSAALGPDLRERTTSLSATLLELAAEGQVAEPLQALLAGRPSALARLLRIGHSTGRAYALAAARALTAIG
jgi:hypothetical protein